VTGRPASQRPSFSSRLVELITTATDVVRDNDNYRVERLTAGWTAALHGPGRPRRRQLPPSKTALVFTASDRLIIKRCRPPRPAACVERRFR